MAAISRQLRLIFNHSPIVVQALSRAIDLPYSGDNLLSNITCLKAIERHQACLNPHEIGTKTSPLKMAVNQGLSNE